MCFCGWVGAYAQYLPLNRYPRQPPSAPAPAPQLPRFSIRSEVDGLERDLVRLEQVFQTGGGGDDRAGTRSERGQQVQVWGVGVVGVRVSRVGVLHYY